ncbi:MULTISPECIES: fatty acid--CoA ligase [unclassified Herbaspirillum]|uniref:fatty acid--CoA ligase n=1 Tax=unclassified Herbaspirillum TaxID=2624150 RepID=UPI00114F4BD8|nr:MULTISPECIES: fatty acid--CoA ligase [unclassified Herbaspirillum]MBB5390989.1 fatty-acyl-CoA synthase [Herbaspirillum sp. SJZ102]TQK06507.1 fatty-acyl-CoA synthase [Herbaspirillum sp. SJZ130]TQK12015.1 fatty-acyl-CoA synthase [Herbaspirillum sp. SJZ106]
MTHPIGTTPSAYGYPLLIKQLLHSALATAADQEIVYGERRHSYAEFYRRVQRLANALKEIGLQPGDTVAVMDWDSHRYLECFFAIPMMGCVLQTVNVRLSPEQIAYTLNHAQADVLLVNSDFMPVLKQIRGELNTLTRCVLITDDGTPPPNGPGFAGEYEALLAQAEAAYDFPDFDENARATTFYTTGTTGLPKGVYFSHRQLVLHTLGATAGLALAPQQGRLHRDDVYMPLTPMFHVHAWGLPYVATMAGLKQVYPGRYVPDTICRLIVREKVTFSHCVPTILQMVLGCEAAQEADLSGWKMIIGGSAMTSSLAQAARERGIDVFTGYGMSETCPILTLAHVPTDELGGETDAALRVKTGRPLPLVAIRTVDEDMRDCPRDGRSTGEVVVRAPWLTQGYLHQPEASEELWRGGWLHTQDIGHIDRRGYLQVTDRIKDVIKTGGEWVSSLQIEEIIARHPGVAETAVIGIQDGKWGERPVALVVLKPEAAGKVTADDIRNHVLAAADSSQISRYGVPDRVQFVTELARTSVGKLNKRAMREQYPAS